MEVEAVYRGTLAPFNQRRLLLEAEAFSDLSYGQLCEILKSSQDGGELMLTDVLKLSSQQCLNILPTDKPLINDQDLELLPALSFLSELPV